MPTSRRSFIRSAAVAAAALPVGLPAASRAARRRGGRVRLGVASYSLRGLDREAAIRVLVALRTPYVSIKSFHLPYESTPGEIEAGRRAFLDAGLTIVGGGLVPLTEDDDASMTRYFEYAKAAGFPLMVIGSTPDALPRVERFVKAYGIAVALHNHGPEDPHFPAPSDALPLIRDMDPRVGLCIDVGHAARTGRDVVQEIADAGDRVLDVHLKDLADLSDAASQCVVGEGSMPIPDIFRQLDRMGFDGYANLEYEIDESDPAPGMLRSIAFMRGVHAGLGLSDR
jgi:sugar phosphate isomerase/epimerase